MERLRRLFRGRDEERTPGGSRVLRYGPEQKRFGVSGAPVGWAQARDAHYEKWLGGSPLVWHPTDTWVPHIDVFVYPPSDVLKRPFFTLVTSGMSDERMHLPKQVDRSLARAELIFYMQEAETVPYQTEQPWYIRSLFFLAHFPLDNRTWLGPGHTLPNGDPPAPIIEGSQLTTALFLPPIFEDAGLADGLALEGEKVNFLWLTFLTDDECAYKLERGFGALMDVFSRVKYPRVLDPYRKSILTE